MRSDRELKQATSRRGIIPFSDTRLLSVSFLPEDNPNVIAWAEEHATVYQIQPGERISHVLFLPDETNLAPFPIKYRVGHGGMIERVPTVVESKKESEPYDQKLEQT